MLQKKIDNFFLFCGNYRIKEIILLIFLIGNYFFDIVNTDFLSHIYFFNVLSHSIEPFGVFTTLVLPILFIVLYKKDILSNIYYFKKEPLYKSILIITIFFIMAEITTYFALLNFPITSTENQNLVLDAMANKPFWMNFLFIVILIPFVEEMIYRFLLINKMSYYINKYILAVVSIVLFAFMHISELQEIIFYLPLSLAITCVYMITGMNVFYSYLFHIVNNFIALVLI